MFALVGEGHQGAGAARNTVGAVGQHGAEAELAHLFRRFGIHGERIGGVEFGPQRLIPGKSAFFIGQFLGPSQWRAACGGRCRHAVSRRVQIDKGRIDRLSRTVARGNTGWYGYIQAAGFHPAIADEQRGAFQAGFIIDKNSGIGEGKQIGPFVGRRSDRESLLGRCSKGQQKQ